MNVLLAGLPLTGALVGCGADDEPAAADATAAPAAVDETPGVSAGPTLLAPADAQSLLASPPAGLIVLDVRTPEEYAEGHLEGSMMIDFQSPTFADEVGALDRDAPIFVYCRSGNRSAQAVAAMVQLGFTDLTELDGGVIAWEAAGLPLVTG